MKAKELRIGNKLQKNNGEIFTILRLDNTQDVLVEEQRGLLTLGYNLIGIPLTEKILLKCGFKKINDVGYCSDEEKKTIYSCGLVDIAFSNDNFFLWVEVDEDPYYSFCWTKIEYLHQLQNIVFAISGTELEINL